MRGSFVAMLLIFVCGALAAVGVKLPVIDLSSYVAIDAASGAVLFEKNCHMKRPPASTTKVMTVLLALERCKLDDMVEAPPGVELVGQSSMHLFSGEKVAVRNLLYAIMLRSANDACQVIARHIAGSEGAFVEMMNKRARELGCKDTHFANPHGLDAKDHLTSAYDLALIAREAMKWSEFRNIAATHKFRIERSANHDDMWMINHDRLLKPGSPIDGIKTGFTVPAGHCFVGTAARPGFRVITVVLNSPDWRSQTLALVSKCFATYERAEVLPSRHQAGRALVRGGNRSDVPVVTARQAYVVKRKGQVAKPTVEVKVGTAQAPVRAGQRLGTLFVLDRGKVVDMVPVVAMASVSRAVVPTGGSWVYFLAAATVAAVVLYRRRRNSYAG